MIFFSANKDDADQNVRNINAKLLEISKKIALMKPDFDQFNALMDRLIDSGVQEPTADLFQPEELAFWNRCEGWLHV